MKTIPIFNKYVRALKAVSTSICYPSLARHCIKQGIQFLYSEGNFKHKKLQKISLEQIVSLQQIALKHFSFREGTVSAYELMVIAALVAFKQPGNLLEIGTFDGNTALQMAANAPLYACVHTIDLPSQEAHTRLPILKEDVPYIQDSKKRQRRFVGTPEEDKITQHFGDTATYDFNLFTQSALLDFCFIDGSHSYGYVKNDTEKVLNILSPRGTILWHDFDPNVPGVYKYLCELSEKISLFHIEGTTLVFCDEISRL